MAISAVILMLKSNDNPSKLTAVTKLLANWFKAFNKVNYNSIMRILTVLKVTEWLP